MSPFECSDIALAQYLDGELAPDQAGRIQQHIAECPHCAGEISQLMLLKRSVRAARSQFIPSAQFRRMIQRQISKPRRSWSRMGFVLAPAAAVVILVIASLLWTQRFRHTESFGEIADLHAEALASTNPVDVVSTDRHTVKPWFEGRIPFSFNIPELAGTEFSLLGGRLIYLHQQPGAQLIFNMRQHKISALIFQKTAEIAQALPAASDSEKRNLFHVCVRDLQDLRIVIIGDVDPAELRRLAQLIGTANA